MAELKEVGFSNGEAKVYLILLSAGAGTLGKIQEKTSIERRNIYDVLNKLIEKGLVSYAVENGRRTYQCTYPNRLVDEIRRKELALKELEAKVPVLVSEYLKPKKETVAQVYRGNEAIKSLHEEILEHPESFWMGGNSFENYSAVPRSFQAWWENWMKRRAGRRHLMHDLVSHGTHLRGLEPSDKRKHSKNHYEYCALPKGFYVPMVIVIFGKKVAQIQWGEQSFAFVIESEKIWKSFMQYFRHFWKAPR